MLSLILLSLFAVGAFAFDAILYLHCDNFGTVEVDGVQVDSFTQWTVLRTIVIPNFENNPLVKITCTDQGVVGGVIATLKYRGQTFSTGSVDSPFEPVSSSDGFTSWVYSPRDTAIWGLAGKEIGQIADDAEWVWNGKLGNTVVIQLQLWKPAKLYLRADDAGEVTLEGTTIASFSHWRDLTVVDIPRFRRKMDLKIIVRDVHRVIGGLLASLHFDGRVLSTGPTGKIVPVSSSDGDTNWQYYPRGSAPWSISSTADVGLIADDAYWVWNTGLENEVTFEIQWGKKKPTLPVLSVSSVSMKSAASSVSTNVAPNVSPDVPQASPKVAPKVAPHIASNAGAISRAAGAGARGIAAPRNSVNNRYMWTGEDMAVLALAASNIMFVVLIACWCNNQKPSKKKPSYAGVDLESSEDEIKELNEA